MSCRSSNDAESSIATIRMHSSFRYLGVHADDKLSLSCLQERLNQLGERVEVRLVS